MQPRRSWDPKPIPGAAALTAQQSAAIRRSLTGRINAGNFDLWLGRYQKAFPNQRYAVDSLLRNLLTQSDRDLLLKTGRFQKAKGVASFGYLARELGRSAGQVADMAATVTAFVPGVGTIASSAIAAVSAIGRGESLANIALKSVRGALPGGALAKAAFDVGVGVATGQRVDRALLAGVRSQIKAGPIAQAAFDAGVGAVQGKPAGQILARVATAALPAAVPTIPAWQAARSIAGAVQQGTQAAQAFRQGARTLANTNAIQAGFDARRSLAVIVSRAQKGHPVALQIVGAMQGLPAVAQIPRTAIQPAPVRRSFSAQSMGAWA